MSQWHYGDAVCLAGIIADAIKFDKHKGVQEFTVGYKDRPDDPEWIMAKCNILGNVGGKGTIVVTATPTTVTGKVHLINPQEDIIVNDVDWPFMIPDTVNRDGDDGKSILYATVWKVAEGVCVHVIYGW